MPPDWAPYLAEFHTERAGITEAVLGRATDGGLDPYAWVQQALPGDGRVLDVACGSGPLAARLGGRWVGLDTSPGELRLAGRRAPGRVVRVDAAALPVAGGTAGAVVCAMALMLVDDPAAALAEVRRVLAPGGRLVALLPASGPLGGRDRWHYARLLLALRRRRLPFPGTAVLDGPGSTLPAGGLRVVDDERRRFVLKLDDEHATDLFVRSLYLPSASPRRTARARAVARRWVGADLGLPLRRIVAEP